MTVGARSVFSAFTASLFILLSLRLPGGGCMGFRATCACGRPSSLATLDILAVSIEGPGAEAHVELGARIMGKLFGAQWAEFCRRHSRHYARPAAFASRGFAWRASWHSC